MFKPELLAPAGSLEKLKIAVLYGADAVYLGGQKYGMRARADNFTDLELEEGVKFARKYNADVYVVLNAFLHDQDMDGLGEYCQFLESIGVAAVIVSDLGVIKAVKESSNIHVHLSTQSSCLNVYSAKAWTSHGLERVIVGRELSIEDTARIKQELGVEVEMFVHGAMCMAYSGNCVISNFTAGRDSNRGGCIQSCRYSYEQKSSGLTVVNNKSSCSSNESFFMSSKDMSGVGYVKSFVDNKIDSLKVEGRMKSVFYVSTICRVYRKAIDLYCEGKLTPEKIIELDNEIKAIPHRDYIPASFEEPAGSNTTYQHREGTARTGSHRFIGMVLDNNKDFLSVRLNTPIRKGDRIEVIPFAGDVIGVDVKDYYTLNGSKVESPRQDCVVNIPKVEGMESVSYYNVVRGVR